MRNEIQQPVKKLRAALYVRVSTDEQAKTGYGLRVQEEKLKAFCKSQAEEYIFSEESTYRDEGFSGTLEIEQRPALARLFADLNNKSFDIVLVYRLDRFFRKTKLLLDAFDKLKNAGVALQSATESFNTAEISGRLLVTFLAGIAEAERDTIRERTMFGKLRAAKTGKWVTGIPPYGFKVDKKTRHLVQIPEEAKVVEKIYHWCVYDKLSLIEIERRMNQLKIPAPYSTKIKVRKTNNYWYKRTIGRILTNEVYTGTFYYRKYIRPYNNLTSNIEKSRLRPKEDWVPMSAPAVISNELFQESLKQLTHNREFARRNRKREYLYSKLIYCSKCNFKMFGGFQPPRKKWEFAGGRYYHGIYRKDDAVGISKRCEWCPQYSEPRLEPIWECLKEILRNPKNMLAPLERYVYKEEDPSLTKNRLREITTERETVQGKLSRANELYINEQISKSQYYQYQTEYRREEQKLSDEATRLQQTLLTKKDKADREEAVRKAYSQIKDKLDSVTYEEKSKIVSFFIERITLHAKENYAEVVFKFPRQTEAPATKQVQTLSKEGGVSFPLVLSICTVSETERRRTILMANPGMYMPKALA